MGLRRLQFTLKLSCGWQAAQGLCSLPCSAKVRALLFIGSSMISKRTLLDRSIVVILPEPDETSSRKHGISAADERLQRLQGTGIIEEACQILGILHDDANSSPLLYSTACVVFHRFFHQVSLLEADVWSVAMAATLLAAKTHQVPLLSVRNLILAYTHVYRKRTLLLLPSDDIREISARQHPAVAVAPAAGQLTLEEKKAELENNVPPMSQLGPVWKEWHDAVVQTESRVLRQLGFTLYWIPDHHPHLFLRYFVQALMSSNDDDDAKIFTATAWRYCNLASRLDLCVRLAPEVICCAAIHCAALERKYELIAFVTDDEDGGSSPWWQVFCGSGHEQDLSNAANAILGLDDDMNLDVVAASRAYIKSRLPSGSFTDPDSFLWETMVEHVKAGKSKS